jgi:hypothetical protein
MDWALVTEVVSSVALAIALAACAGLRAWLPLLLAGGMARLGFIQLGHAYGFLASNQALILFGVATVIEIAGDKIPAVDHALDVISTVVRPVAGSILAASVLGFVHKPLVALALGVAVGAPSALVPHAAKAGVRTLSTAFTAGLANPILSLLEDVLTVVLFVLAVLLPIVVALFLVATVIWILRRQYARRREATT